MFRLPPLLDFVRFERGDAAQTAGALREGYYGQGGIFNYNASKAVARALLSGGLTESAAVQVCHRLRLEAARNANEEVVRLLCRAYPGKDYLCHRWPRRKVSLRHDMASIFDARFYFIDEGRPVVFVLQPRRAQGPTFAQFGTLAGIVKRVLFVDDFEGSDIEICDASIPVGSQARYVRRWRLKDLIIPSDDEIAAKITKYVRAIDILRDSGFQPPARPIRKAPPPIHPDLWDEAPE